MDKQKQIEEMAKKSGGCLYPHLHCGANGQGSYCNCDARKLCENLIEHYQPKIPEGSLVLTKEYYESEAYVRLIESDLCKKCRQRIGDEYEKIERDSYVKGNSLGYHNGYLDGSKETAEKIFEELYTWLDLEEIEKYGFVQIQKFDFLRKFREIHKKIAGE